MSLLDHYTHRSGTALPVFNEMDALSGRKISRAIETRHPQYTNLDNFVKMMDDPLKTTNQ